MEARPLEVRQAGPTELFIRWNDGTEHTYPVRELRLACPCANCVDELSGKRILDPARVPKDVRPVRVQSVGNYALKFSWSDGHDTGLYSYDRLREICG
ncbi:MAG: DUF971 domain-containing protein [Planctomycetota bacterium]